MRRVVIVMLILMHSTLSFAGAGADSTSIESRQSDLDVIGLEQVTVHREELIEVFLTLHNIGENDETFSFQVESDIEGLTTTGLPCTQFVESGYLRQVKFNLTAEATANFGNYNLELNFTSESNPSWSQIESLQVRVAPYSNLNFGVSGVSSFIVTPGTRTSVAMNITNNATLPDDIMFNLYSQTGWNWGWSMNSTEGVNAYETVQPDGLTYVFLWIDVPPIVDGLPLSNTGPRFQLKAVSSIDGAISQWSFDLLMNDFYNVTIDEAGADLLLEPGGNDRLPVMLRNNGNTPNNLNITLEAISADGTPIEDISIDDRLVCEGWTIALFGGLEDITLQPNESRTVEIGFQAPVEYNGEVDIRLRVFANGAQVRMQTIDVGASIDWQRSGTVQLLTDSCQSLLPGTSCGAQISVQNTGNAFDSYSFEVVEKPQFVDVELLTSSSEMGPNSMIELDLLTVTANTSAYAFELGDVVVEIKLLNTNTVIESVRVPVKIAPVIQWVFTDVIEEIDSQGRLSIAMTLRNEGNTADGLLVQLQSSHSTQMSFMPPAIAVFEEDVEFPRSFEVSDIPIGYNFTVRAWVELPTDQQSNGTVWVNTTVRSQFEPSTQFVHTSQADYKGMEWQQESVEDSIEFSELLSTGWAIFKAWFLMICAVLFSFVVIFKSIVSRNQRNLEQKQREAMYQKKEPEAVENWMEKFNEKESPVEEDLRMKVRSEDFQEAFQNRAGSYKPASEPVHPELTHAASKVLNFHSSNELRSSADSLLEDIKSGNVSKLHKGNAALQNDTSVKDSKESKSASLPSEDEFDI